MKEAFFAARHRARKPTTYAVLVVLACATASAAQPITGVMTGSVTDETGQQMAGVIITVVDAAAGVRRTATTDADGRYVIATLPMEGAYLVTASYPGFGPAARERIVLTPSGTVAIDFTLRVAAADAIAVSAEQLRLDGAHSTVEQRIDERLIQTLPLFERNFLELASLAAGFTGNPNFPSTQGQLYWNQNVLVDGGSHFSKWRSAPRAFESGYGLDAIQEVRVLTNVYSAEYGDALASVTTAVTRAGTNQWHGSASLFARDAHLDALPAFAAQKPRGSGQQYAVTIGGPIVRDRTRLFASYERRRVRDHNVVTSPVIAGAFVPDTRDEHMTFIRVDHQYGPEHLIAARYNGQLFDWHHEPAGLTLPGSGVSYRNDVHTILVTDAWQTSSRTLNEARAQFARYIDVRRDLQSTTFVSRAGYSIAGGALGPRGFGANPEDTWEGGDTVALWRGPHAFKLGASAKYVRAHNESLSYGNGAYFFAGAPDLYPEPFLFMQGVARTPDAVAVNPRGTALSAFVQDDWRLTHAVTLNAGVRYDVEQVFNVHGYDVPVDANNVQPRIGAAWDVTGSGRTIARAGIGVYTQQQLLYPINRVQVEGPDGIEMLSTVAGAPAVRDVYKTGRILTNPYSVQYAAGVEHLFGATVVGVDYVRLYGRDLLSLVDVNAPVSIVKPAQRTVAEADATRHIEASPGGYRKVIVLGNEGRSWYRALQVKADRSGDRVRGMASYTLSRAEDMGNYELPEDSLNLAAERARASTDITHNVTAGVTWSLPGSTPWSRNWTLSGISVFRSNRPYTISWGDDRNGTSQGDARPGGRNTGKTGPFRSVDVALARRVGLRTASLEGRLEAFNIFNATNYDQYVGQLLSPLFARPISAFPPRRLQLAAVLRF